MANEKIREKSTEQAAPTTITSHSPATGRALGEVPVAAPADIAAAMRRARLAQPAWFAVGLRHRIAALRAMQAALHAEMDAMVNTLVHELGKPPAEALAEVWAALSYFRYYADNAGQHLAPEPVFSTQSIHHRHWVQRHPYGVVLVITPWNFPLLLSVPHIAAALVAGNVVLFKPSEYATQSGEMIARIVSAAGLPPGVFQILHGRGEVGAALVQARPDKIAFTGGAPTGRRIAAAAGELLIPVTLELGAKDAAIVLEDADLDHAARGIAWAAMFNTGQACVSVERLIVRREVAEALTDRLADQIAVMCQAGPGEAPGSTMGVLTTEAQARLVEGQVNEALAGGAQAIIGGHKLEGLNGRGYAPTLLTNVQPWMRIAQEETFGPVVVISTVESDAEAIAQANSAPGLNGSVWTRDRGRGMAVMAALRCGHASLNSHMLLPFAAPLPWGGVGESGYGRAQGREGLHDMTYAKVYSAPRLPVMPNEPVWYPYTNRRYHLLRRYLKVWYARGVLGRLRALFGG